MSKRYICPLEIVCVTRYDDKTVTVPKGYQSNGADVVIDIYSESWWVHDKLCDDGTFDDGTPCNNLQCSTILHDILLEEGRWFRARSWWLGTWLFGGGKARKNGMW